MVRAGEKGFLINDFKKSNLISIGWEIGDLTGKSDEDIKKIMSEKYKNSSKTSLSIQTAQVIKFVNVFKKCDYVLSYNQFSRNYFVGIITSDYYYSDKLAKKYNQTKEFYPHFRDVKWIGVVKRDDLSPTSSKPLKASTTIFSLNDSAKNEILYSMNAGKIEWTDFYMEFADKLLEYKNNRAELINKIYKVFDDLGIVLPTLEWDSEGNPIRVYDIDPFTVFALFNRQISAENRINIVNQIKKEFSLKNDAPYTFCGIAVVNNLKTTFYHFSNQRGEEDIDNLWDLFQLALTFSHSNRLKFIETYDDVLNQKGVRWNITMALNWIRPFNFINLDSNNRYFLSSDNLFSNEFREEIKDLKNPPKGNQYIHICDEVKSVLNTSGMYENFPQLSHATYLHNGDNEKSSERNDENVKYWVISAGFNNKWWSEFRDNNEIGIGFDGTGDLNQYKSKDELKNKFQEIHNDNASHKNDAHACWQFVHEMQIGDVVFVKMGSEKIIARGLIESDYEYDKSKDYHKIRKVKWTHTGSWHYGGDKWPTKTLTEITDYPNMVNDVEKLFVSEIEEQYPAYNREKFLNEVYINDEDYNTLVELLKNKKNLILEGAPGVGKTFMAKKLAYSIIGFKNSNQVQMVQFHQSYSYEDFVMGYRPYENGFKLREGIFYNFCKKAREDSENDYFFIIDEINRGNISKIFGELFMLIEADKRGDKNKIQLLYLEELFFIPKNVHIIGLMNTADRSLAMIDYALRRRFAFFNLKPGFESDGFKMYQQELDDEVFDNLINMICELNIEIENDDSLGAGFKIGHSFFSNIKIDNVHEKLKYIVNYELIPLLSEYWFDESEKVDEWSYKLKSVLDETI